MVVKDKLYYKMVISLLFSLSFVMPCNYCFVFNNVKLSFNKAFPYHFVIAAETETMSRQTHACRVYHALPRATAVPPPC